MPTDLRPGYWDMMALKGRRFLLFVKGMLGWRWFQQVMVTENGKCVEWPETAICSEDIWSF
jgi:hypothetical protein